MQVAEPVLPAIVAGWGMTLTVMGFEVQDTIEGDRVEDCGEYIAHG